MRENPPGFDLERLQEHSVWEVLRECTDRKAQNILGKAVGYALCIIKYDDRIEAVKTPI